MAKHDGRCDALTRDGKRCTREATRSALGRRLCAQHWELFERGEEEDRLSFGQSPKSAIRRSQAVRRRREAREKLQQAQRMLKSALKAKGLSSAEKESLKRAKKLVEKSSQEISVDPREEQFPWRFGGHRKGG